MEKHVIDKLVYDDETTVTRYTNGNNPNIYYYFRYKGKTFRGSTGTPDLSKSKKKCFGILYEIKDGTYEFKKEIKKKKKNVVRFDTVVKDFLKNKEFVLKPNTHKNYVLYSKFLLEYFGKNDITKLPDISVYDDYKIWRSEYHKLKKGEQVTYTYKKTGTIVKRGKYKEVGNVTLNRECRLLVSVLRYCKENKFRYHHVFDTVEIPPYRMLPEKSRTDILSKREYLSLKKYWLKRNPYYWNIISFINNTGVRYPSELNRIKWGDIDLKHKTLIIKNRKSGRSDKEVNSTIPLVGTSTNILLELKGRENVSTEEDDFVFVDDKGNQIKYIEHSFKESLKECNIKKDITMYSLRHLFTTRHLRNNDIPIKMISMVLGHVDTTMVERHYGHLNGQDVLKKFIESEERKIRVKERKKKGELEKSMNNVRRQLSCPVGVN